MKPYIYKGPDVTMGRFGHIKRNDQLFLTDQEAECISRDNDGRFELITASTKLPEPGHFSLSILPGAEEKKRVERNRLASLSKENNPGRAIELEVSDAPYNDLVRMAAQMNIDAARQVVAFDEHTERHELIARILAAQQQGPVKMSYALDRLMARVRENS